MKMLNRLVLTALLALPVAGWAQNYPNKPIKMVIPLAVGSAVDNAARLVTQKMGESMGQNIVIENLPGSSGLVGADRVARATPDGYTIGGFNDSILTMVPNLNSKTPWNALTDFAPVSLVGTVEWGLVVKADSPYRTLADFLAAAKTSPGKLNYGSGGNGSPQHIAMALIASRANINLIHIPYKGATPAALGVAAGEVDVSMQGLGTVTSLLQAGKLRLLAVSTPERLAQYPSVPTFQESGMQGFTFNSWFAMVAPAGTPAPVIKRLNDEVRKALANPELQKQLLAIGVTPRGTPAAELGAATKKQFDLYRKVIQDNGITAD